VTERIRYCPTCGRVTEDEMLEKLYHHALPCNMCWNWLMRQHPFRAKRTGES
jgi:hypothetical protein